MAEKVAEATVTIEEKAEAQPAAAQGGAQAAEKPTAEQLKAKGWGENEIEAAKKRGMVSEPGTAKKGEEGKKPEQKKPEAKEEQKGEEGEGKVEEKPKPAAKSGIPDVELTPDQEAEFLAKFGKGHPVRGLYFRQKNERKARQAAQQENLLLKAKLQVYEKGGKAEGAEGEDGEEGVDPDKPMTMKDFAKFLEQQQRKREQDSAAMRQRSQEIAAVQTEQEEYARTVHEDFDDTVEKAKEVIKDVAQEVGQLVPEGWRQKKVMKLVQRLRDAAQNADQEDLDGETAAMIAYELGQFHPEYGKPKGEPKDGGSQEDSPNDTGVDKKPGSKVERAEQVEKKRPSSAQVQAGGGRRTVAVETMTPQDFLRLDYKQRSSLKKNHPKVYDRLMRSGG